MKQIYKFQDYYTLVATKPKSKPTSYICFAKFTNKGDKYEKLYLYVAKDPNYGFPRNARHNCTLSKDELKKLVRITQSYVKFSCRITETTYDDQPFYKLNLSFKGLSNNSILFILTALRYSYEFPFNVICKDSFRLCKNSHYQNRGFFNICNFIFKLFFSDSERTVHSLCEERVKYTRKSIVKERILKADRIHSIFDTTNSISIKQLQTFEKEKQTPEFWENEFEERLVIYNNYINKFIK